MDISKARVMINADNLLNSFISFTSCPRISYRDNLILIYIYIYICKHFPMFFQLFVTCYIFWN